ncbi:MAG: RNA methyltransferase [Gallionella sp.]
MKSIQSRDNPFYKQLAKLSGSARQRNQSGQALLDGAHLLSAYLDSGHLPQHILLNSVASRDDEIVGLLQRVKDIPVTQLDDKLFTGLSELKTPTGILSLIDIPRSPQEGLLGTPQADNSTPPDMPNAQSGFALLVEDIQDPGNLGSMLRSAAAAGCDVVFLSPGCADAWSPKVLRAAMGGHFALRIQEQQNLQGVAEAFSGQLLAASLHARRSLYDCDLRGNVGFMVGNEGAGLSDGLLRLATQKITIPMHNNVESLNAAAATAICLFEAVRQRHAG